MWVPHPFQGWATDPARAVRPWGVMRVLVTLYTWQGRCFDLCRGCHDHRESLYWQHADACSIRGYRRALELLQRIVGTDSFIWCSAHRANLIYTPGHGTVEWAVRVPRSKLQWAVCENRWMEVISRNEADIRPDHVQAAMADVATALEAPPSPFGRGPVYSILLRHPVPEQFVEAALTVPHPYEKRPETADPTNWCKCAERSRGSTRRRDG